MITDVLRAMAEKIAAGAPPGWRRAELRGFADEEGKSGHHTFVYGPGDVLMYGPEDVGGEAELHAELCALAEAVGGYVTVELVIEAKGRFEAVLSQAMERDGAGGFLYVLDRDARPEEPGVFQPGPVDAVPAGDPDEAIALLGAYLRERDRALGRDTYAPPPALPTAYRSMIESRLPAALPGDLRALYAHIDGDGGAGLLDRYPWFGLEKVESHCRPENRTWAGGHDWREQRLISGSGPPLAVRRVSDHPCWIPFAGSSLGDYLAVDLAPGPGGRPGQVIRIGRRQKDGPDYVADSVTGLLRRHVAALRAGAYRVEGGELVVEVGKPRAEARSSRREARTLRVVGVDAASMRGVHARVERLEVRDAPFVDFGPLRGASMLWQVTVEECPGADLTPLRDTPVERLDLAMDVIDLEPLAGHGSLRTVRLRTGLPVDLAPLLSCHRLYGLDLADADVPDLSLALLGEFRGLLYLRLRREQWERVGSLPGLAAAVLAAEPPRERRRWWMRQDRRRWPRSWPRSWSSSSSSSSSGRAYLPSEPSLRAAVAWAGRLAGDASDVQVVTGKYAVRRSR